MSLVEVNLFNRLTQFSGLIPYVGSRVYPVKMPQNASLPVITFQRISGERVFAMDKGSGLAFPRFQIDVWSKSYKEVKEIAEQVRLALEGYRNISSGVDINGILYLGDTDEFSSEGTDLQQEIFRVSMDFRIWHNEPEPT
jgi:hypothetical protein